MKGNWVENASLARVRPNCGAGGFALLLSTLTDSDVSPGLGYGDERINGRITKASGNASDRNKASLIGSEKLFNCLLAPLKACDDFAESTRLASINRNPFQPLTVRKQTLKVLQNFVKGVKHLWLDPRNCSISPIRQTDPTALYTPTQRLGDGMAWRNVLRTRT